MTGSLEPPVFMFSSFSDKILQIKTKKFSVAISLRLRFIFTGIYETSIFKSHGCIYINQKPMFKVTHPKCIMIKRYSQTPEASSNCLNKPVFNPEVS